MLTALWSSTAAALTLPQAPAIVHAQYGERAASAPTPMPTAGVFPREGLFLADNELVEEVVVTAVIAPDSPAMTLPKVQVPALPNLDLSKVYSPATMDKLSNIQKQAGALYIDPKALDEQAGALYGKLKDQASSIDQKEIERQLKAAQKALEDNAPIIQKGLDSALIETQKSLKVAEPVLKKTADDLTPVLQSAGEQALTQLTPVLQKGLDTAGGEASGLLNSLGASLSPFVGQAQKAAEDALNSAASSIDKELQDAPTKIETSLPKELREQRDFLDQQLKAAAPVIEETLTKEVAPTLKRGLNEAKPVLKKAASDLAPVLQSAGEQAITAATPVLTEAATELSKQATPFLQNTVDTAIKTIQALVNQGLEAAGPYADDVGAVSAIAGVAVAVPLGVIVLIRVAAVFKALLLPALAFFVVLVGLGVSAQISQTFPQLGSPAEIFVRLGAVSVAGGATVAVYLKVTGAISSAFSAVSKSVDGLSSKLTKGAGAQEPEAKKGKAPKKARAAKGQAAEEKKPFLNPFREPDEFSAVPPPKKRN